MHSPVFQRWIHTRAHTRIHTHTRLLASTYTRAPQAPAVQLRGTGDSLNSSTRLVSVSPPFSLLCGFCVWVSVSCVCVCVCVVFTPSFNIPCVSSHSLTPLLLAHLVSPLARHCSPPFISSADRRGWYQCSEETELCPKSTSDLCLLWTEPVDCRSRKLVF